MFPLNPRAAIAHMPYLVDRDPRDTLMVVGLDGEGVVRHRGAFPLDVLRPLDEPLLESSMWGNDIVFAAVVAYTEDARPPLQPLVDAWSYRGRETLVAAWAGRSRWSSYLCSAPGCCATEAPAYDTRAHRDAFEPLADLGSEAPGWRRARWAEWQSALANAVDGAKPTPATLERLAKTLYDIPLRDAVLAHSAAPDVDALAGITAILEAIERRSVIGAAIPAATCLAAMRYLDGELDASRHLVQRILETEEYSLARLLHNGLEMRAPASLLARSFAHFSPLDLIAA